MYVYNFFELCAINVHIAQRPSRDYLKDNFNFKLFCFSVKKMTRHCDHSCVVIAAVVSTLIYCSHNKQ